VLSAHGKGFLVTKVKHFGVIELDIQLGRVKITTHRLRTQFGEAFKRYGLRILDIVDLKIINKGSLLKAKRDILIDKMIKKIEKTCLLSLKIDKFVIIMDNGTITCPLALSHPIT